AGRVRLRHAGAARLRPAGRGALRQRPAGVHLRPGRAADPARLPLRRRGQPADRPLRARPARPGEGRRPHRRRAPPTPPAPLTLNGGLKSIPNVLKGVQYDPRGLPTEMVYQNDVRTAYEYTPGPGRVRRLTTVSPRDGVLAQVEFTYDLMEVLLSSNDTAPG